MRKVSLKKSIESYLENVKAFRDYDIKPLASFKKEALRLKARTLVFQINKSESLESQLEEALSRFCDYGFSNIVFYI